MTTVMTPHVEPLATDGAPGGFRFEQLLPLALIDESAHNPRRFYDPAKLEELAADIGARGITNPVLVRFHPETARYELAGGHRRCRAARVAGLTAVPAMIHFGMSDDAFLTLIHADNHHRADVDAMDEAVSFRRLVDVHGWDVATIAAQIGRSPAYVGTRLKLNDLSGPAQEAVRRGFVPISHAELIARLPEAVQAEVLETEFNLSVEKLARAAAGEEFTDDAEDDEQLWDDTDESFEEPERREPFARYAWQALAMPTLAELKAALKRDVYRRLDRAEWALDDATLVPEAGACTACQKRSGCAPLLFPELDTGADACLDTACYKAKADAHWERTQARAATRTAAAADAEDDDMPTAPARDWAAERRAEEQKERAKREKQQRGRTAAVRAIAAAVPNDFLYDGDYVATLFQAFLRELHTDSLARLLTLLDLDTSTPAGNTSGFSFRLDRLQEWATADTTTLADLRRALVLASLGDETGIPTYGEGMKPVRLQAYAEKLQVDVVAIAKAAEKAKPAKATKAAKPKAARGKMAAANDTDEEDDEESAPVPVKKPARAKRAKAVA